MFLNEECRRVYGFIPKIDNEKKGEIMNLIDYLREHEDYWEFGDLMDRLRRLRNRAVHVSKPFEEKDAIEFIESFRKLAQRNQN
jgi:hypothetical protein